MQPVPNKLTKEDIKQVCELYGTYKMRQTAIAKRFKVTQATIEYHLKRLGLKNKKVVEQQPEDTSPEETQPQPPVKTEIGTRYGTTDKALVTTLLSLGEKCIEVRWGTRWAEFVFQITPELNSIVNLYERGKVSVEPRSFLLMSRRVSAVLFNKATTV